MNERIRELAKRLGYYDEDCPLTEWDYEKLGMFAELVLKQCLSYINDSFGDVDYVKFMIKRDFGVEE